MGRKSLSYVGDKCYTGSALHVEGDLSNKGNASVLGDLHVVGNITSATEVSFLPILDDSTRGDAGTAGRVIFNTDDSNLNIDTGVKWILPDGTDA